MERVEINERQHKGLLHVQEHGTIARHEYMALTGVSERTAANDFADLVRRSPLEPTTSLIATAVLDIHVTRKQPTADGIIQEVYVKTRQDDARRAMSSVNIDELITVLRAVQANDGMCGRSMISKILRGSRDARLLAVGLQSSPSYSALGGRTQQQIGCIIDEALSLGLISMRDEGWDRGRGRQEAHFPVLSLTPSGARLLAERAPASAASTAPGLSPQERARHLAMRAMVQGAYALEDWKHRRIEAADFVRELPGDHIVLFAMERHPGGRELLCLYSWDQRTNTVVEVDTVPAHRVPDVGTWFERELWRRRRREADRSELDRG